MKNYIQLINCAFNVTPRKVGGQSQLVFLMKVYLNWFSLDDLVPLVALAWILTFVGQRMAEERHIRNRTRWFSAIAFLLYVGIGLYVRGLGNPGQVVEVAIRALLAGAVGYGVGSILFALIHACHVAISTATWKCRDGVKRLGVSTNRVFSLSKPWLGRRVAEPIKPPPPAPAPVPAPRPPPTAEERAEKALNQFKKRLQLIENANLDEMEESAAKAKAKQTYLRDIDEVIS